MDPTWQPDLAVAILFCVRFTCCTYILQPDDLYMYFSPMTCTLVTNCTSLAQMPPHGILILFVFRGKPITWSGLGTTGALRAPLQASGLADTTLAAVPLWAHSCVHLDTTLYTTQAVHPTYIQCTQRLYPYTVYAVHLNVHVTPAGYARAV